MGGLARLMPPSNHRRGKPRLTQLEGFEPEARRRWRTFVLREEEEGDVIGANLSDGPEGGKRATEVPFRGKEHPIQDVLGRSSLTVGPGEPGTNPIYFVEPKVSNAVIEHFHTRKVDV